MDPTSDSARNDSDSQFTQMPGDLNPGIPAPPPAAFGADEATEPAGIAAGPPMPQVPSIVTGNESFTPEVPRLSVSPPRPMTPAELAASMTDVEDAALDQAVEEAMSGMGGAELGGGAAKAPSAEEPSPGDLLVGRVANIGSEDILLDFDSKSLGAMPLAEVGKDEHFSIGDSIEVMVVGRDDRSGLLNLSRRKARRARLLNDLKSGQIVECHVTGMNKGGLEVDVEGLRGFIPASQVDLRFMKDISDLLGQRVRAEVTRFELDDERENIVLSRRRVLLREEAEAKERMFQEIAAGQIHKGVVRSLTEYGAFVDIGGADGLLHVTDMSWGRVNKPEDVVKVGDQIEVAVIKVNKEKRKISLSLKQTKPDPWKTAGQKYTAGMSVKGRVVRLESFGAFVEIEPGLDGLLPISEMSWTKRVRYPQEVVKEGDVVDVSVLGIDAEKKRMSLSLKALGEDPWAAVKHKYPQGAMIRGKVVRTTDFGAFVQLEDGIDGLIHISELSEERVKAVTDKVQAGQEVEVRVLHVDPTAKKIGLSLRPAPTRPSPEELARIQAEHAAEEARRQKRAKPRRGGITVGWDEGMSLGALDPSKFAP